ncbi:hypothetical protein KY284_037071 [Solanum tuberosum]|nr:hypothetical protein KY284_037071 [Solanum tuberosum]
MELLPTWTETGARLLVTRFFKSFIQTGCIILLEEGDTIFSTERKCSLKVSLRVHSMQFYWKVATRADVGLADAFIHGDFSFVDKNECNKRYLDVVIFSTQQQTIERTN